MASVTMVTHEQVDAAVECDGPLISTYLNSTKCGKCEQHVPRMRLQEAQEKILDHQTFYGLALVLIDDKEES